MRSQAVAGLTTTAEWDAQRWAAHRIQARLNSPDRALPKLVHVPAGAPLDHGGVVLVGDVWRFNNGPRTHAGYEVTSVDRGTATLQNKVRTLAGVSFAPDTWFCADIPRSFKLISRAQKPVRAPGELRVGDKCIVKQANTPWNSRRCEVVRIVHPSRWPYMVRRDDGAEGMFSASELELVEGE